MVLFIRTKIKKQIAALTVEITCLNNKMDNSPLNEKFKFLSSRNELILKRNTLEGLL